MWVFSWLRGVVFVFISGGLTGPISVFLFCLRRVSFSHNVFCLRRHTFCQQQQKVCKKRRLKPMVSRLPLLSRVSFVMGRSGNRLSNRPAAAPTQAKKILRLPPGNTDPHNQSADCLHRRVNRFPATLWRENRDTSSKPPRFIRHRRRFDGFLKMPFETNGFRTSFTFKSRIYYGA